MIATELGLGGYLDRRKTTATFAHNCAAVSRRSFSYDDFVSANMRSFLR